MIRVKEGVDISNLQPQMLLALYNAHELYRVRGADLWITSSREGKHMPGSLHYAGLAVDLRVWNLPHAERDGRAIATELGEALGRDYDVLYEGDHLHVEYDPKEG